MTNLIQITFLLGRGFSLKLRLHKRIVSHNLIMEDRFYNLKKRHWLKVPAYIKTEKLYEGCSIYEIISYS